MLPEELRLLGDMKRWVCHENKIPKNPITGGNAMADKEETWTTYERALAGLKKFRFSGVGFQFGLPLNETEALEVERVTGIDLDHVILEDGSLEPVALEIVKLMDSYTEISPSGTGLHILCKAKMPNIGNKVYWPSSIEGQKIVLEVYNHSRYFTFTANAYKEVKNVASRTEELNKLYEKYFLKAKKPILSKQSIAGLSKPSLSNSNERYPSCANLTDTELIDKMFSSNKGYGIRLLFNGDMSGYSSQSEADLALCNHLAYWTNGDAVRMDNLFRQSGLMRDKWEERHGAQTYGEMTISKALSNFRPYEKIFIQKPISKVPAQTSTAVGGTGTSIKAQETPQSVPVSSRNIKSYVNGFISDWQLKKDLSRFRNFANRKTGFGNIDSHVSFYPGLYVLGAISSLGKTTFVHQMADQLVRKGEHVLFFSLEQTCLEIVTKGISRLMAKNNINSAVSAIDIRRGIENQEVLKAMEEYASFTEHEIILECNFETTIDYIVSTVESYIKETSIFPVVIVDYLQVIRPMDIKQNTKDAVDTHVRALKKLQKEKDLVVVVVSSLNRQNYLMPIDYESFKESGGIEYTADVIWGLQLNVINEEIFSKEGKLKDKREKIKQAKRAIPRDIEFVCLKNRYGDSNYTCRFKYYAQFDYFVPVEDNIAKAKNVRL